MIRCEVCGKLLDISNKEVEIIEKYGEKTSINKGLITCNFIKCDKCIKEENRQEQLFHEQSDFERRD